MRSARPSDGYVRSVLWRGRVPAFVDGYEHVTVGRKSYASNVFSIFEREGPRLVAGSGGSGMTLEN